MATIRHRVGIAAPQARVYEALTTTAGLADWWTERVEGNPQQGGELQFFFGGDEPSAVMEVTALATPTHVSWQCVGGPDEWVGTPITFDLSAADGETVLHFTHTWREPVEFMYHCSTKWAYFMLGLKARLEGGPSTAYPHDLHISNWDS